MSKVKVDLAQAIKFAAQGFVVECFVLPEVVTKVKATHGPKVFVGKNTMIAIGLEGKAPVKGDMAVTWPAIKKSLWETNITAIYPRHKVDAVIATHCGRGKGWIFSALRRSGVIRVVTNE